MTNRKWSFAMVLAMVLATTITAAAVGLFSAPASGYQAPAQSSLQPRVVTTQHSPGWALDRVDQRRLPLNGQYRYRSTGAGVTAYLIDGGLDVTNEQFGGRASLGVDLAGGGGTGCLDEFGVDHGTFVAGIVGGRTTGVAKDVKLVEVRALRCGEGTPSISTARQLRLVIRGIDWVIANAVRPAVVNMSLNFRNLTARQDARLAAAMKRFKDARIAAVVSAGNDNRTACRFPPADAPSAIVVGASKRNDKPWREDADFGSNFGPCVDLYAPGHNITAVAADGGVFRYAGSGATSWAAPFVTGAAALYLAAHPGAGPAKVRSWLLNNATSRRLSALPGGTPNRLLFSFARLR